MTGRRRQKGGALVIVLALVATLSFIALAISEATLRASERALMLGAREALMWRALGVEALAASVIETAFQDEPERLTPDSPFLSTPIDAPMEGGYASIAFEDRSACFNVNSLVRRSGADAYAGDDAARAEFAALLSSAGAGGADLSAIIVDWIDADSVQERGGVEDSHYTALPTPYRTGGTLLADISELRAMAGFDRTLYAAVAPLLCVLPDERAQVLNLNMLTVEDAPQLAALFAGRLSGNDAQEIIRNRPPGGFGSIDQFWANSLIAELGPAPELRQRTSLVSRFVGARAEIVYGEARILLDLTFEIERGGAPRLVARRLGWSDA